MLSYPVRNSFHRKVSVEFWIEFLYASTSFRSRCVFVCVYVSVCGPGPSWIPWWFAHNGRPSSVGPDQRHLCSPRKPIPPSYPKYYGFRTNADAKRCIPMGTEISLLPAAYFSCASCFLHHTASYRPGYRSYFYERVLTRAIVKAVSSR